VRGIEGFEPTWTPRLYCFSQDAVKSITDQLVHTPLSLIPPRPVNSGPT